MLIKPRSQTADLQIHAGYLQERVLNLGIRTLYVLPPYGFWTTQTRYFVR